MYFYNEPIKQLANSLIIIVKEHNNYDGQINVELICGFKDVLKSNAKHVNQLLKYIYIYL